MSRVFYSPLQSFQPAAVAVTSLLKRVLLLFGLVLLCFSFVPADVHAEEPIFALYEEAPERWLFSIAVGSASRLGQVEQVFSGAEGSSRLVIGYENANIGVDLAFFGATLRTANDENISTLTTVLSLKYFFQPFGSPSWPIRGYVQSGIGNIALTGPLGDYGDFMSDYTGLSISSGGGLMMAHTWDEWEWRFFTDVNREWVWLDQETRHIHGGILHWTTGVGVAW